MHQCICPSSYSFRGKSAKSDFYSGWSPAQSCEGSDSGKIMVANGAFRLNSNPGTAEPSQGSYSFREKCAKSDFYSSRVSFASYERTLSAYWRALFVLYSFFSWKRMPLFLIQLFSLYVFRFTFFSSSSILHHSEFIIPYSSPSL